MLKHGDALSVYEEQKKKPTRGRSKQLHIPEFIENKPTLDAALIFYWDSFNELSTERLVDGGAIPHSANINYSQENRISDFDSFLIIIRKLDNTILQHQRDKIKNGS